MKNTISLIECPRDAMQGWAAEIPTAKKIAYLNALLRVGFDSLDFGSFVSPKAIPQMADTKAVLAGLDKAQSNSRLLAIVANTRGATEACAYPGIDDLGFPFSVSETFQQRNANSHIEKAFETVGEIQDLCGQRGKRLVVYISMAFGNPYGDPWTESLVMQWMDRLQGLGVAVMSLADTVGLATPNEVRLLTEMAMTRFPNLEIGVHLHSRREMTIEKVDAAFSAGCRRFDGALKGIGGCPMAGDELIGNVDSLLLIDYFREKKILPPLNEAALAESLTLANDIFQTQ